MDNLPEWYKGENRFKVQYKPETKEELISLIKDKGVYPGEIDISLINDLSYVFANKSYFKLMMFTSFEMEDVYRVYGREEKIDEDEIDTYEILMEDIRHELPGIEFWDVSHVYNMSHMFDTSLLTADLSSWNVSNVRDMSYMFRKALHFNGKIGSWNVSNDVKYYGMFRGTELEKNPPEWFRLKNEFEIKYYPESKEELIRMLNDENILAGEIDVSKIDNVTEALDNINRYNKSYLQEHHRLLSTKKGIDMEISKERFVGNSYSISSNQYIQSLEDISSEYHDKLIDISMQPFYEKLENPKKLIHDDYPGIEFWNVPNLYELLNKIYE